MSDQQLQKVSECRSGEWDAVCPICTDRIDEFTAPVESYEAGCSNCDRWYFKTDAVCKPAGVNMTENEVREEFTRIANSEPTQIVVELPKQPGVTVEKQVFNPVLKRMSETIALGIEIGWKDDG